MLKNMFGVKDSVPNSLFSLVVYKFSCTDCGACYVGESARHFSISVREHLFSDRNPHIYRHLKDSESCRDLCSEACFSILDWAPTVFQLKKFNLTLVVNVSLIITINLYFSIFFFRLV